MPEHWSRAEVEATVSDYFDMLAAELRGMEFNKADHNRKLRQRLPTRSKGSIERKHQNISAILIELGYPYIIGYKRLGNYQELLRQVVHDRLEQPSTASLDALIKSVVCSDAAPPTIDDLLAIEVPPPVRDALYSTVREDPGPARSPQKRNYLELEARNQSLGLAGEQLILQYEHQRLWRAGCRSLADRIEHVSNSQGDHLGYDIASFETDGRERLIEVKTTRFGPSTPFFVSTNEVAISKAYSDKYHLYRLFAFARQPKLFSLAGSIDRTCDLKPTEFVATAW